MSRTHNMCLRSMWVGLIVSVFSGQMSAQGLPSKQDILAKMTLANDYFMANWPDPTAPIVHPDKTRPSNIWTRATYYEGMMALYYIDSRPEYYNYAVEWGDSHDWGPAWGTKAPLDPDNQCCAQTYIELYQIDPQPERILPMKAVIDGVVASPTVNTWSWIDTIHMAMPVFAKLGAVYDDDAYFNKMYSLYHYTKTQHGTNGLYNPVDHLWWRDYKFDPPVTAPNGEDLYWSRGNGWVFAALARVLDVMPADAPHRAEYVADFQDMAAALIAVQREDGFWNASLHDPNHYGGRETSGTAMFTFGLAWGVNNGLLVGDEYRDAAIKGWNGLANDALHPDGFLGYVQGTADDPSDWWPFEYDTVPNFDDFALGAFLLAGSEAWEMASPALAGDYNDDGIVDAADYTVWRDNLGAPAGTLPNDVDGGVIGPAQYATWKANFGRTWTLGALGSTSVPEPTSGVLMKVALVGAAMRHVGGRVKARWWLGRYRNHGAVAVGRRCRAWFPDVPMPRSPGTGRSKTVGARGRHD